MWTVVEGATYQHIFSKLDDPFEWKDELVQWGSACGRSFGVDEPQPNPKKKKCKYCLEKEKEQRER